MNFSRAVKYSSKFMKNKIPPYSKIHTIVFDFDGVFTDNKVWVDERGRESVSCDRADGLAFDLLRRYVVIKNWQLSYFILSQEKNPVVSVRCKKMNVSCIQSVEDKREFLRAYLRERDLTHEGLVFIGNDLNDLGAIQDAGLSVAPSDAHPFVLESADLVLPRKGGQGFVRAFIENLIGADDLRLLLLNKGA
jgi:3-deoxy-D-manno-octulosonate 8-phosphate phosphatase (KDO 8-P phosphatase)